MQNLTSQIQLFMYKYTERKTRLKFDSVSYVSLCVLVNPPFTSDICDASQATVIM